MLSEVTDENSPFLRDRSKVSNSKLSNCKPNGSLQWSRLVHYVAGVLLLIVSIPAIYAVMNHVSKEQRGQSTPGLALSEDDSEDHSDYSEAMGNRTWRLNAIAGCAVGSQTNWECAMCKSVNGITNVSVVYYEEGNLLMMIGFDSKYKQLFIAYRGSEASNYPDYNLDFIWADYKGDDEYCNEDENHEYCCGSDCKVHAGFQNGYYDLKSIGWQKVRNYVQYYSDYPVMVTGYSLGGAMAHHAVLDLVRYMDEINSDQRVYFYTHGSPRMGNSDMIEYLEELLSNSHSPYWRIVWKHDIVPKLPPFELGYRHSGNEVWYYCHYPLKYTICEEGDCKKCSDGHGLVDPSAGIADHLMYFNYYVICDAEWYQVQPLPTVCDIVL